MDLLQQWGSTTIVTVLLCLYGYFAYYKKFRNELNKNPFNETDYPQLVSGLGVFGTFMGITYGLLNFNSNDLQGSIPSLLGGMSTAFITSIIGMAASMYMNHKQKNLQESNTEIEANTVNQDATIADLIKYLQEENTHQREQDVKMFAIMASNNEVLENTIKSSLEQMTKSIVGDGESTLITQLKLMRGELHDGQRALNQELQSGNNKLITEIKNGNNEIAMEIKNSNNDLMIEVKNANSELITEFRNFANYMTENTNKAFIKALEDVIRDFNTKLTEQFGENFKQLNAAVKELVTWQEHYKNTVIEVTENQKVVFTGIENAKNSLAEMASKSEQISSSADKLSDIVVTSATYHDIIEKALYNLNYIAKESQEFIPSLNKLAETFEIAIKSETNSALNSVTVLNEAVSIKIEETNNAIASQSTQLTKSFNVSLEELNHLAGQHYETIDNSLKENINSQNTLHSNAISNIASIAKATSTQIENNSNNITNATKTAIDEINMHAMISTEAVEKFTKTNLDIINKEIEAIRTASVRLENNALEITKRVSDNISGLVDSNNKALKTSTENISNALETQLKESLKTLGTNLASVSQKFVNDYTPLTQSLKEVVEIARGIKR